MGDVCWLASAWEEAARLLTEAARGKGGTGMVENEEGRW